MCFPGFFVPTSRESLPENEEKYTLMALKFAALIVEDNLILISTKARRRGRGLARAYTVFAERPWIHPKRRLSRTNFMKLPRI
jgi:hypothetical protein